VNISLQKYLQKLSGSGFTLAFSTNELRYGEFTMYSILGPEENIMHLTFAPEKHAAALGQLRSLSSGVSFTSLKQEEFPLNTLLRDYFHGRRARFPIKINSPFIDGASVFHKRVWQHISTIPYGKCITYRELAVMAGSPRGARAVGMACGTNPLVLIIPCHRVVAVNGLGGFAGGTDIKKALLDLEGGCGYFREQTDV
jgi:methylated-DNA-[protein]-cysteine S-methyltransferase